MTRETVYATAWQILKLRLGDKTSWGRNELASLMAECVEEAITTIESNETPRPVTLGESTRTIT